MDIRDRTFSDEVTENEIQWRAILEKQDIKTNFHLLKPINPLAGKAGTVTKCDICVNPATLQCISCHSSWCSHEHFLLDDEPIHMHICSKLTELWFMTYEKIRSVNIEDMFMRQSELKIEIGIMMEIIEVCLNRSRNYIADRNHIMAVAPALRNFQFAKKIYGPNSREYVAANLLLAKCHLGLRKYDYVAKALATLNVDLNKLLYEDLKKLNLLQYYESDNKIIQVKEKQLLMEIKQQKDMEKQERKDRREKQQLSALTRATAKKLGVSEFKLSVVPKVLQSTVNNTVVSETLPEQDQLEITKINLGEQIVDFPFVRLPIKVLIQIEPHIIEMQGRIFHLYGVFFQSLGEQQESFDFLARATYLMSLATGVTSLKTSLCYLEFAKTSLIAQKPPNFLMKMSLQKRYNQLNVSVKKSYSILQTCVDIWATAIRRAYNDNASINFDFTEIGEPRLLLQDAKAIGSIYVGMDCFLYCSASVTLALLFAMFDKDFEAVVEARVALKSLKEYFSNTEQKYSQEYQRGQDYNKDMYDLLQVVSTPEIMTRIQIIEKQAGFKL